MENPERIHILLNAADGFKRFTECGMVVTRTEHLSAQNIITMLAQQKGRLFCLMGWVDRNTPELALKVSDVTETTLGVVSHKPPFEGEYAIAPEPPPQVTAHGNYFFDLVLPE